MFYILHVFQSLMLLEVESCTMHKASFNTSLAYLSNTLQVKQEPDGDQVSCVEMLKKGELPGNLNFSCGNEFINSSVWALLALSLFLQWPQLAYRKCILLEHLTLLAPAWTLSPH